MHSVTTAKFRAAFKKLPPNIKIKARRVYQSWKISPHNAYANFKLIHQAKPIYSIRIGLAYRALGVKDGDTIIWFWIGSHSEYEKMIKKV